MIKVILEWPDVPKYFNRFAGPTTRSAIGVYKNPDMEIRLLPGAVAVNYASRATNGAAIKIAPAGTLYPGNLGATINDAIAVAQITHDNSLAIFRARVVVAAMGTSLAGKATIEEAIDAGVYDIVRRETKAKNVSRIVVGVNVVEHIKLTLQIVGGADSKEEKPLELSQIIDNDLHISETVPCAFGIAVLSKNSTLRAVADAMNVGYDTDVTATIVGTMVGTSIDFEDKNFLDLYDKVQKASKIGLIILVDELTTAAKVR